jgi:hypothetical protein
MGKLNSSVRKDPNDPIIELFILGYFHKPVCEHFV